MADLSAQQQAAGPGDAPPRSMDAVLIDQRYLIHSDERLPHLDRGDSLACAVEDLREPEPPLYALLCDPKLPLRSDLVTGLMNRVCPHVLSPRATGVVAPAGRFERRFAVILERPGGPPLSEPLAPGAEQWGRKDIAEKLLPPVIEALEHLEMRGLTHRNIRPDNLFFTSPARETVVLGECCCAPPGISQPVAYEPVTTVLADVEARGEETIQSDLYALGVTVLALVSGQDPAAGRDAASLATAKASLGSHAALVDNQRFDAAINALLVGLLTDDPERRWTFDRLRRWIEGVFDATQRPIGPRRAQRVFAFMGRDYLQPGLLATALDRNPSEALAEISQGRLEQWLRIGLADKKSAAALQEASNHAGTAVTAESLAGAELVTRACLALDPTGPLRFRGLAIMLSGFGPALARAFADEDRDRLKTLGELLRSSVFLQWSAFAPSDQSRFLPVYLCTALQNHMQKKAGPGGLERCLYELNPGLPCLSPLVANHCAMSIPSLMTALDVVAATAGAVERLVDRHVAAFIAARHDGVESILTRIDRAAAGGTDRIQSVLSLFTVLQRAICRRPLHGITACAVQSVQPLVGKLKSALRRDLLTQKLARAAQGGDLGALLTELDLANVAHQDEREYAAAVRQFHLLGLQIEAVGAQEEARQAVATEDGYWIAALIGYAGLACSVTIALARLFL